MNPTTHAPRVWLATERRSMIWLIVFSVGVVLGSVAWLWMNRAQPLSLVATAPPKPAFQLFVNERENISFRVPADWTVHATGNVFVRFMEVPVSFSNQPDPDWSLETPSGRNLETMATELPFKGIYLELCLYHSASFGRQRESPRSLDPLPMYPLKDREFAALPANLKIPLKHRGMNYAINVIACPHVDLKLWRECCEMVRSFTFLDSPPERKVKMKVEGLEY